MDKLGKISNDQIVKKFQKVTKDNDDSYSNIIFCIILNWRLPNHSKFWIPDEWKSKNFDVWVVIHGHIGTGLNIILHNKILPKHGQNQSHVLHPMDPWFRINKHHRLELRLSLQSVAKTVSGHKFSVYHHAFWKYMLWLYFTNMGHNGESYFQ